MAFRYSAGLVLGAATVGLACGAAKSFAPASDFAHRHHCPESRVAVDRDGADRALVSGCGASELYVRRCATNPGSAPPKSTPRPLLEPEAFDGPGSEDRGTSGCAWSRE